MSLLASGNGNVRLFILGADNNLAVEDVELSAPPAASIFQYSDIHADIVAVGKGGRDELTILGG